MTTEAIRQIASYALHSGARMGPYLLLGIVLAAAIQSMIPAARLRQLFAAAGAWPVLVATVAAVSTPLCSCGTVSLMIPLLAAGVPWGPIFAWLIASPIISPTGVVLIGGTLGWDMAIAKILVGLILGVGGGLLANRLQTAGLLAGQSRVPVTVGLGAFSSEAAAASRGCCTAPAVPGASCCGATEDPSPCAASDARASACCEVGETVDPGPEKASRFIPVLLESLRSLLPIYVLFLLVAGAVGVLVPTEWITLAFGEDAAWGVPAAAALGMPLYTSVASAVPLTASLVDLGMARGAALAFLLTGPGASLPALSAVLIIARVRVMALYLMVLYSGSVAAAYLFGLWF